MLFYTFLPRLLNMSLTAGVVIVFVLLLRLLLKKAPKVISYALWGIVLFRLLCPVSVESRFSLFGFLNAPVSESGTLTSRIEYVPDNIVHMEYPEIVLPVPGVDDAVNNALPRGGEQLAADPLEAPVTIATYVWMSGILAMAVYAVVSYTRLRRKLITASPLRDNIYLADEITSPFVMGLFRPKIYLPSSIEEQEQPYIIMHEQHHIRRFDHVVKALAFTALCIHWFNPLVWVAFIMAGKDMEMSCDEAVVKKMGAGVLADYTASLLSLATGKHIIAGMPLAFGEGDTKGRIRNLANWKKPAFWVILAAVIACITLAVCLLTNPKQDSYSLGIVIPAGSQETIVYADEEISPLGNYITVMSGDGLLDTEVSLKPVQAGTETAYDEPVYLTPGMPVKMEAEKGGWFKIGVNVQNDTDEDKIVYVNVENVVVRISSEAKETETLSLNDDFDTRIDIRDGGAGTFAAEHSSEALLTEAINNAILERNKPAKPDGLYHCASFALLEQVEIRIDSEPPAPMQITVYGFALHQAYEYSGSAFHEVKGSHIPVAITFEVKDGGYVPTEYWEPRDGSYYVKDIRDKFPDEIEEEALDTQKYILAQKQNCYTQAVEYGGVDIRSVIEQLFETIESSPAHSSDPGDYIDEHPIEYRELTYYGQYTLCYCFEKFLQGNQTGLHGHIMASACRDIMLAWGEGYAIDRDSITGQDWFDAFKSNAELLDAQYSDEDMGLYYPGTWLLLKVLDE